MARVLKRSNAVFDLTQVPESTEIEISIPLKVVMADTLNRHERFPKEVNVVISPMATVIATKMELFRQLKLEKEKFDVYFNGRILKNSFAHLFEYNVDKSGELTILF